MTGFCARRMRDVDALERVHNGMSASPPHDVLAAIADAAPAHDVPGQGDPVSAGHEKDRSALDGTASVAGARKRRLDEDDGPAVTETYGSDGASETSDSHDDASCGGGGGYAAWQRILWEDVHSRLAPCDRLPEEWGMVWVGERIRSIVRSMLDELDCQKRDGSAKVNTSAFVDRVVGAVGPYFTRELRRRIVKIIADEVFLPMQAGGLPARAASPAPAHAT